jgi:type IV pilus assembly protein PilA
MLTSIKQRMDREDEGFTLIELMVVVLIIAILLAIAIPTFLGARNSANQRAAQSNLRNALTAEQTYWTNNQVFDSTTTVMSSVESGITWVNAAPTSGNNVDVAIGGPTGNPSEIVLLEAYSKDGNCYYVEQSDDATTSFTGYGVEKQNSGACYALTAPTAVPTPAPATGHADSNISSASTTPTFYTSW